MKHGLQNGIGGYNKKTSILAKFEGFFSSWKIHAERKKLDFFQINKIRAELFLQFEKFCNSSTKTEDRTILKTYLEENPDIIIVPVDKSKNLDVFDTKDYLKKLTDIYDPLKFKKLRTNPINVDISDFNEMIG